MPALACRVIQQSFNTARDAMCSLPVRKTVPYFATCTASESLLTPQDLATSSTLTTRS
jgi:hypothetical protein